MKFCTNLLMDINFEPASIQPCCNTYNIVVPRLQFSGGTVPLEDYRNYILTVLNVIQTDNILCKGCPKLIDMDINNQALLNVILKFRTVSLNMHRFLCNCKCVYCELWSKKGKGYTILPALQSLYDQKALDESCAFSWGGGEPTIQPDFEDASSWIDSIGKFQNIHTNAIKFSPSIATLLAKKSAKINVSLDSASPTTYKKVKGVDKFLQVITNILEYRKQAFQDSIDLKYIIFDENNSISEIENFLLFASRKLKNTTVEYSFDFRDITRNKISTKSILAAAFFKKRAVNLGLHAVPFFIPNEILKKIDEVTL